MPLVNAFYTLVSKDSLHSACKFVKLPARFREEVEEAGGLVLTSLRLARFLADQESDPTAFGRFDHEVTYAGLPLWIPKDKSVTLRRIEELAVMLVLGAG